MKSEKVIENEEERVLKKRFALTTSSILILFLLSLFFSFDFHPLVKGWLYRIGLSYRVQQFVKETVVPLFFIGMIVISGYNPFKWSRSRLEDLASKTGDMLSVRRTKACVMVVLLWFFTGIATCIECGFDIARIREALKTLLTLYNFLYYIITATFEEMLMKGMVYRTFSELKVRRLLSMVFTSLIFAAIHIFTYQANYGLYVYFSLFVGSMYSLLVYNTYPSLLLVIVMHVVRNMLVI